MFRLLCVSIGNPSLSVFGRSPLAAQTLHDGWLLGAEEVARQKTPTSLNRVLLLSDGNANVGLQDVDAIKSQCAQLADNEVTTSTYGLDHQFNEHLMIGMADGSRPGLLW